MANVSKTKRNTQQKKNNKKITQHMNSIAGGNSQQTSRVVTCGGVDAFCRLLFKHSDIDLVGQVIWGLGNIAADRVPYRDMILSKKHILPRIVILLDPKWCLNETKDSKTIANSTFKLNPTSKFIKLPFFFVLT